MNKNILIASVAILYCSIIGESQSSCFINDYSISHGGSGYNCISAGFDTSGNTASCGDGCSYTYNNGVVTITATENYGSAALSTDYFAKSRWEDNKFRDAEGNPIAITNFVINGFNSFGGDSFHHSYAKIEGKNGILVLNNISWNAFDSDILSGNIIWGGKSYGGYNSVNIAGNLIIEDTATVTRSGGAVSLLSEGKVFCKTDLEKCKSLLKAAGATDELIAATQAFPEGCLSLNLSGSCAKCKNENFKLNDGECDRLRWTPAEAAKVLRDDNNNSVTITFKK